MLTTYGYHDTPAEPATINVDGITYHKIERLPRNVRPGDVLIIGDNTDRDTYHQQYVTVTDVDTYPQEIRGYRRYAPQCVLTFRYADDMYPLVWRWASWGHKITYRDSETKECVSIYRARHRTINE